VESDTEPPLAFKYQPLEYQPLEYPDSIRILRLQPSLASSSEIHCRLVYSILSECDADLLEHYVALSYVWSSQENLQPIRIDGQMFNVIDEARTKYQVGALQGTPQQTPISLLISRRGYRVTDPRDIIYGGHLGVAGLPSATGQSRADEIRGQFHMLTIPDYGKNALQVLKVFTHDVVSGHKVI
jgi:hypothetical protein